MVFKTTMTGSFYRPKDIEDALLKSPTGELSDDFRQLYLKAERQAIRDQVHPDGSPNGLSWVSNGEQRKSGYTTYIPNRFEGFSLKERVSTSFSREFYEELAESNPALAKTVQEVPVFTLPKIVNPLRYVGEKNAKQEALDASKLKKEERAERVFIPSPSPGVITVFYPPGSVYKDHSEYLFSLAKELSREYRAILSVDGIDLQIDAPDLAMAKSLGVQWGVDFYDALADHVDAINESIRGLPSDRIRVHYCYGNYSSSHLTDPPYEKVLGEILRLKAGTIVGEMANARHAGDPVIIRKYTKENGWPKGMKFAVGVLDVKSPFVETPETVWLKLNNVAEIDEIGPENVIGGTDCGFQTFLGMHNIPYKIALKKLRSLAIGARLNEP
ncbi:hypothetical protein ApAK_00615 [Thermoplasmatales archaeon AK]|nr:hypothetical protein [Thermoplasmatales archaeon AK]